MQTTRTTLGGANITCLKDSTAEKYAERNTNSLTLLTEPLITFQGCGYESFVIPDNVTKIGNYAFADSKELKSVVIPDSVESIGTGAFGKTALKEVEIENGNKSEMPHSTTVQT